MVSYQGKQIPIYDINVIGLQLQNLQQQMTDYGRIVSEQQQAIMQLLQKQQTMNTVQWPSVGSYNTYPPLMKVNPRNSRDSFSFPQVPNKSRFNQRRRTPKDMTLGDFIPKAIRKGQSYKKVKQVRFAKDEPSKKNAEKKERMNKANKERAHAGKKANVRKTNAIITDNAQSSNIALANRFLPLTIDSTGDDMIQEITSRHTESRTTTDAPIITKVIGPSASKASNATKKKNKKSKTKVNLKNLQVTLAPGKPRIVTEKSRKENSSVNIPRFHQRPYLEPNKIREWLKENIQSESDGQITTASQGANEHIDRFMDFAVKTAFTFDQVARALFDVQVWSFYIQLGTKDHQPYWAREVVSKAKTRESTQARQTCENMIIKLNTEIERLTEQIQTIATQHGLTKEEYEEVMFNYMNESLRNVRRQNELKMKMAKIERAEFVAWENFMNIATPAQKAIALTIKGQLVQIRAKSIRYETAATYATPHVDMLPRDVPALQLRFKFDEKSMSDENVKDIYKSMDDITRDYRLKATELYIRTAKVELDYHTTRVRYLMEGSLLTPSEKEEDNSEAVKAFQVFIKVHRHHTATLAEISVLSLKERHQKVDAPDPTIQITTTEASLIPVPELLSQVGQIQEVLLLNRN